MSFLLLISLTTYSQKICLNTCNLIWCKWTTFSWYINIRMNWSVIGTTEIWKGGKYTKDTTDMCTTSNKKVTHALKPASHWLQLVVRLDEIYSDYFPPIVFIPLPDRRTKTHIGSRKLPPIVGPKSDMADYHWLPPIITFPWREFSHCPIFHPTLRSCDQSGNGKPA